MRILSVIRQVLDAEESVKVRDGQVDTSDSKLVIDNMDEYGIEEALRLRENQSADDVTVLAIGGSRSEEALLNALALGADRAIWVETYEPLDPIAVSSIVAEIAKRERADLIITGGQQADWDSQALGAATAERLNWPQLTWTTSLSIKSQQAVGVHDIEEGAEAFSVSLPVVITTQQGLNEPRYPTLPNIIKAKKKELVHEQVETFSVAPRLKVIRQDLQARPRLHKMVDGKDATAAAEELVHLLRNEAKVVA